MEDARKRYTLDLTTPFIIPFALLSRGRQGYRDFRLLKVGIRQKLASSMRSSKVAANERHSRNTDISFHFFSREIDEPTSETTRTILLSIPIGKLPFFFSRSKSVSLKLRLGERRGNRRGRIIVVRRSLPRSDSASWHSNLFHLVVRANWFLYHGGTGGNSSANESVTRLLSFVADRSRRSRRLPRRVAVCKNRQLVTPAARYIIN